MEALKLLPGTAARVIGVALLVLPLASNAADVVIAPGEPAPQLMGRDLSGTMTRFPWSEGKVTLVNFWATWCAPCRSEMPTLQRLYEERLGRGFRVIGVHMGRKQDDPAGFADELGVTYPMIQGDLRQIKAWGGVGLLPTSYLVDADGMVLRRYVGATVEMVEGLEADIAAALAGEPLPEQVRTRSETATYGQ